MSNGNEEIRKMLDEAFDTVMGDAMDKYAEQLHKVYRSFETAGFTENGALGFVQIMFADDIKRVRDRYEQNGGGAPGMGFGGL